MTSLLIFARYPELGKVKTRLAAGVGEEEALRVYRWLLEHTRAVVGPLQEVRKTVWLAEPGPGADRTDAWLGFEQWPQPAGDLGQKMQAAFTQAFADGAPAAVIIGTDCPGLTTDHLRAAFTALATHDLVLGPAADGGYYLLGMKQLWPNLFELKAWSTASVRADTLADARRLGLRVHQLPQLHDIDTADDLRRWQQAAPGTLPDGFGVL
ncbi:TIGR04282 family arsenosugar biosynthesis glycosyltransferase [Hymenobacter weizhouensis]|uniref:TIGR04282 family arsenosugar biosynthesis glycosyltransferase n=1 Tax=Hymenobacter sp. YIM 151500-1 TaxID=2987689 RepID=UPI0022271DA6|nr:TIGR04282 family arsenosugar biosynthesis glycosyltransferase [Hymenobacter sp. YIM 151500-1]UYZ64391.1 TIGR04282 family arsenosugar biosynthesis glycosyltransferase [Hymenobacter sp. YIM 151500-1]